jgi:HEAT repeat-containing protein 5
MADITTDGDKSQSAEASLAHHVLVCALHELGCLVQSLGTSSAPLITEPAAGIQ